VEFYNQDFKCCKSAGTRWRNFVKKEMKKPVQPKPSDESKKAATEKAVSKRVLKDPVKK